MSELPPSALTMKPQDGVHQSMCLQLQNNNDFLKSSSASSASSASLSSSSPDSTYSLSSLDVELPEGMMGRKAAISEDDSGIQSPDCRPDDNDNSVSVYLDANEEGWHAECDDQDNVTIIQNRDHKSDNVFSDAGVDGEQGRRDSGDSSATEAQLFSSVDEEGEDEEEEDSFLSLRSADGVMRKQSEYEEVQMCSSNKRPSLGPVIELHQETFQDSVDHPNEEGHMFSSTVRPSVDLVSELHQEASQVVYSDKSKMQRSTKGTDVDLGSELDHKAPQESVELHKKQEQMQCSDRSLDVGSASQEILQESVELYKKQEQMQCSDKSLDVGSASQEILQESVELYKKQEQMQCSDKSLDVGSASQEILQESMELLNEENQVQTSAKRSSVDPNVDLVSKIHQEAVQTTVDLPTEKSPSPPPAELILNQTMSPSVSQGAPPSTPIQDIKDPPCFHKRNISQNNNDPPDLSHTSSPMETPKIKYTKVELKRFSRPNLKDVKPKVISRATSAPRPANTDHIQSAAGCEKNSLTTRSRAVNRREQGDDGVKKNRASSSQARATTPITISDSDSKSTWPPMVKKQPPEFPGSKVVPNGCHVQTASSKVTETMRDERGSHKDEVVVKETSRDGDVDQTVSSDLRPPGVVTRVPTRGCVSAGVRAAPLAGAAQVMKSEETCARPSSSSQGKSASTKPAAGVRNRANTLTKPNAAGAAQVMKSEETCARSSSSSQGKSASTKPAAGVRNRANTLTKPNAAGQKATAHVIQSKTTQNALQRGGPVRPSRNSATVCPSSRGPRGTRPAHTHTDEEEEKKNRSILHLRSLVAHGNRKLEALAIVVQHIFNEREEALKQKKEISIQLKNLREELAQSVVCCERLECEKASVCAQLDAAVLTLQQQHQVELVQLEERLRDFYSAEWDKAHQAYQDEADRCTALMRQQVEEVKSKQEALRTEQEVAHSRQIEELRQGYETMLAELQKGHERDRQELDNTLKRSEAALNERIVSLMEENEALSEQLRESEEKRKALADKSQRDSRVVYLEQELESLKVVLDIKTNQLHQHDKKLMQMDKLIESNVKLEEFVTKLQQENEDYKARMDKHAELSRQLSTEQAMLQQTLQKESKANKRLSMENEELLWKLHNGLSPRNSASFPSSPISPR
ncbi:hypothetical protein PGIGA_G00176580 [Pangasianodon gigas]|uniref:Uncharacterized protein n=1 Tax=Pangasianodon gigas TaxID=30993 RepID=A0ACC5XWI5_PANGG|nr:hypothetical protein [Pangasianodon gigas]